MATRSNTLSVQVVAKNRAGKELDSVTKAFKDAKKGSQDLDGTLPPAAGRGAAALSTLKVGAAAAGVAIVAIGAAAFGAAKAIDSAVTSAFDLARSSAEMGEAAFQSARRLSTTTEFFTGMSAAAKKAGASTDDLESAMGDLTQRAANIPDDFKRWGIETRKANGDLKSSEELVRAVADRMAMAANRTEQFAMADELMSDAGRRLLPVLREGSAGIDEMLQRSAALGSTISTTSAIIAHEFSQELGQAQSTLQAVSREAGSVFQPALTEAFKAAQTLGVRLLTIIEENRDTFEAFATKSVALVARGFSLLVETGSAASHVIEGLVSIFTFRLSGAFDQARALAGEVSDAAGKLANELEAGAAVTRDEVVPAVEDENKARDSLLKTLLREKKERKSLRELQENAAFDLVVAETDFQKAVQKSIDLSEEAAAKQASAARAKAEGVAREQIDVARMRASAIEGIEAGIVDTQRKLAEKRLQIQYVAENPAIAQALGLRRLDVLKEEEKAILTSLKAQRKSRAENIRAQEEEIEASRKATAAFVDAKDKEGAALDRLDQKKDRDAKRKKREEAKAERERARALKKEIREQEQARDAAVAQAEAIGSAAQSTTSSMISLFRTMRDENAKTEDVMWALVDTFTETSTQAIGIIQQQLAAKQSAAAAGIAADAGQAAGSIGKSVSETTPWFVAVALAPAMMATMFGLVKAFAGKFHTGGDIPGPLGAERLALVQGGERVVSIAERRREATESSRMTHQQMIAEVTLVNQALAPLQSRTAYERTYRGAFKKSMQRMTDNGSFIIRPNSRVIGRRRRVA